MPRPHGGTRYRDGTPLQLVFLNENPFKYTYRIQITGQPIDRAVANAWFESAAGAKTLPEHVLPDKGRTFVPTGPCDRNQTAASALVKTGCSVVKAATTAGEERRTAQVFSAKFRSSMGEKLKFPRKPPSRDRDVGSTPFTSL